MDQDNATLETQERSSLGRRSILMGAASVAWTVPTVVALGTTAAAAGSFGTLAITVKPSYIYRGNFTVSYVYGATPPEPTYVDGGNVTAVTIEGTSPKINQPQTITVTVTSSGGGTPVTGSVGILANATTWTVTPLNLSTLQDGTLTFTASSSLAPLVNPAPGVTSPKDTVAPKPTVTYTYTRPPGKTLLVTATLGTVTSPTADLTTGTITVSGDVAQATTSFGPSAWSRTFTAVEPSKNVSSAVVQSDTAGNKATVTVTYTTS